MNEQRHAGVAHTDIFHIHRHMGEMKIEGAS